MNDSKMKAVKDEKPQIVPLGQCIANLEVAVKDTRRQALTERNTKKSEMLKGNAHFSESVLHHLKRYNTPRIEFTAQYWEERFPGFAVKQPSEQQKIIDAELKRVMDFINKDNPQKPQE